MNRAIQYRTFGAPEVLDIVDAAAQIQEKVKLESQ